MALKWWKLKREFLRLKEQLSAVVGSINEPSLQRRHDAERFKNLSVQSGKIEQKLRIALFLIYQPGGVPMSLLQTCQYLVSKGYAPLVVSNAPLGLNDQALLLPWCWRLIQRPNFGYDFGGYRDGIWLLEQGKIIPDRLLILNDSIWFPVFANADLLDQLEAYKGDLIGALAAEDRRKHKVKGQARQPFLSSFLLLAQRPLLESEQFWRFWREYRCSNSKSRTIRRGERGFSYAMVRDGQFRLEAIQRRIHLDALIDATDLDSADSRLGDLVTTDPELKIRRTVCLTHPKRDEAWLESVKFLMREFTDGQNYLSTAPLLCLDQLRIPYVKKSRDSQNMAALRLIVERAKAGEVLIDSTVLAEMEALIVAIDLVNSGVVI